ncbi:MAG: hypothetical protein KKB59_19245 [Spirochaetes bacterium]|nr:hypothetical protein [Spirochaetota bacterium]
MPLSPAIPTRDELRRAGRQRDFFRFQRAYLSSKLTAPTPDFHREIVQLFESDAQLVGVQAPRGHAKTTLICRGYALWRAIYGKSRFVLLVGESYSMAARNLAAIYYELSNNPELRADFDLKFEREREDEITFASEYGRVTIVSMGRGHSPRGYLDLYGRPDLILVDDMEEIKRVQNPALREEDMDWLIGTLKECLAPGGKLGVIGTILHEDSVLARIVGVHDKPPADGWATAFYKGIQDDGKALWPEYKSKDDLMESKAQYEALNKVHLWYREIQGDPRQGEDAEFSDNWIQYVDVSDPTKREWWNKKKDNLNYYVTCDTSWAKRNPKSDYSACVVTAWDEYYNCFVLPPVRGKWGIFETWDEIVKLKKLYPLKRYGIERGATKSALDDVLTRENRLRGWQIRFDDLDISCGNEALIRAFFMLFARGEVYLVGKPEEFKELIEELRSFPNGVHDDLAVAVSHSVQIARPAPSTKPKEPAPGTGGAVLDALMKKPED